MSFDLTVTVSVIIALCAIISPIIVALINNRHQIRMKQLEIARSHKINAFEIYLGCFEKCIKTKSNANINNYSDAFGNAMLYASSSTRTIMLKVDNAINESPYNALYVRVDEKLINSLCKSLQSDIGKI